MGRWVEGLVGERMDGWGRKKNILFVDMKNRSIGS
jgi:hypothetical protein